MKSDTDFTHELECCVTSHHLHLLTISVCVFYGFPGDYFGILMDEKVTGFPFNITENPMYWGSTANYLGLALM